MGFCCTHTISEVAAQVTWWLQESVASDVGGAQPGSRPTSQAMLILT